ncbi:MAG: hypothetical protein ACI9FJ_001521, partial [Alteromonadaceae bacterium]
MVKLRIGLLALSIIAANALANDEANTPVNDPFAVAPDPFATDPFATDPFATDDADQNNHQTGNEDPFASQREQSDSAYTHELSLLGYYQSNNVNRSNRFNPGLTQFSDNDQLGVIDWRVKAQWTEHLQGRLRTIAQWQKDEEDSNSTTKLLEGYLNWTSNDYAWQMQLGRIKTEWSNGYNWSLTNLLRPYRDRPYIDLDDPAQQQGWDMATISYTSGSWHYSAVVADFDEDDSTNSAINSSVYLTSKQYITRIGFQGSNDYELLLHKIPGQTLDAAASFSSLITDEITFRMEWSLQHQREQLTEQLQLPAQSKSSFHQFLLGGAYTAPGGTNFRLEYLKSQHGFTDEQWRQVRSNATVSRDKIDIGQGQQTDYDYLGNALSSLANGQLRQSYLYFMITGTQTEN